MSFLPIQLEQLLRPIAAGRVLYANNQSHVSQQDIRAHLIRCFGFDGWDKEILELTLVRDVVVHLPAQPAVPARDGQRAKPAKPARDVPGVTYRCRLRLTVRCPARCCVKISEDVGTGTSPNLPDYGDAHDFAAKNAVSYALKRCATDLGDQFGLSLYNKGQTSALVGGTLVGARGDQAPAREGGVEEGVPDQVSLGEDEGGVRADELPEPAPDEQPAEPAAPSSLEGPELPRAAPADAVWAKAYRADIARLGKALGLSEAEVMVRFAEQYRTTLEEAIPAELLAYRDALKVEAEEKLR